MKLTTYIERNGLKIPVTVRQYLHQGYKGGYLGYRFAILQMDSGRWMCFVENENFGLIREATPTACISAVVRAISSHLEKTGHKHKVSAYERTRGIPRNASLPRDHFSASMRLDTHSATGPWLSIETKGTH